MATITQIEVANFLCEGYETRRGKEWAPLYRGQTLRLFGGSTAIQLDNGHGKTSLTETCLYLLTRDPRLKASVQSRMAPKEAGWTHVRIEFGERHVGDGTPAKIVTDTAEEFPGTTYVVGFCWNRDFDDPVFYCYSGGMKDAPCYVRHEQGIELVANDVFRKRVESLAGARWDKWNNREWQNEIRHFTNMEVLKQNVDFQVEGGGDYSAMINKVKIHKHKHEDYDVAFFRQFIAPELLRRPLGEEGDADEQRMEDTLLKSLKATSNALIDITEKKDELAAANRALEQLAPVIEQAKASVVAHQEFQTELNSVADRGAVIQALAERDPLPGIPRVPPKAPWQGDAMLQRALAAIIIDRREGLLVSDEGLANLIGIETKKLNERASEKAIRSVPTDSQLIELKGDLKQFAEKSRPVGSATTEVQVTDFKGDLKQNRGGRRTAILGYQLEDAITLSGLVMNLKGARNVDLEPVLKRAYGIAGEIDTNIYRRAQVRVRLHCAQARRNLARAKEEETHAQQRVEYLLRQSREAKDNEVAYESFLARKLEFPQSLWDLPLEARTWAENEQRQAHTKLSAHDVRVGTLNAPYELWQRLKVRHGEKGLAGVLEGLEAAHDFANAAEEQARMHRDQVATQSKQAQQDLDKLSKAHAELQQRTERLEALHDTQDAYRALFGEADPEFTDPHKASQETNHAWREEERRRSIETQQRDTLTRLKAASALFRKFFGEIDPEAVDPSRALADHQKRIGDEQQIIGDLVKGVEALRLFRERHSNVSPAIWLEEVAQTRSILRRRCDDADTEKAALEKELDDLDKFAIADDRMYGHALSVLEEFGVRFTRLHEVILAAAPKDKRAKLLSLFSAALSAPVVDTLDDADRALAKLEEKRLVVPLFLRSSLVAFAQNGTITMQGAVTHGIWVGRHTRQVDIVLDPDLIPSERERIAMAIAELLAHSKEWIDQLKQLAEDSEPIITAIAARDALLTNAEPKYQTAIEARDALESELPELEARATVEALTSLSAARDFNRTGGDAKLDTLQSEVLPAIEQRIAELNKRLAELKSQTTMEALRLLSEAREYQKAGGEQALRRLQAELLRLLEPLEALRSRCAALRFEESAALASFSEATMTARALSISYQADQRDLKASVHFEADDGPAFMASASDNKATLARELESANRRLQDIDFVRAASFVRLSASEERDSAKRMAEAEEQKISAAGAVQRHSRAMIQLEGRIAELTPFVEDLHDLACAIRAQQRKLAAFSADIRDRIPRAIEGRPDIQGPAELLRLAAIAEEPATTTEIRQAIAGLLQEITDLQLDTHTLKRLHSAKENTQQNFVEKRDLFCEKAKSGEVKGLNSLEIGRIAAASTVNDLKEIERLTDAIKVQLEVSKGKLESLNQTMVENKDATIENLARLASLAELNLKIMNEVMQRTPNAHFIITADIVSKERIAELIDQLIASILQLEQSSRRLGTARNQAEVQRRNERYRDQIHEEVYDRLFVDPQVRFYHSAIWGDESHRLTEKMLSTGQRTALMMMWLIKQADYALTRSAKLYGSRREQKKALKESQRILFFDGLFSNLTNEDYIDNSFQGLKDVGDNFQLIGLIHNPHYRNNEDLFPIHLVGKSWYGTSGGRRRRFVSLEPKQRANGVGFFTSAFEHNRSPSDRLS